MIEIKFLKNKQNIVGFELKGHADFSEYGKDIVCSAVTAQSMMIYNGLNEVMKIPNKLKISEDGGYMFVSILDNDIKIIESAQDMLKTFLLGIKAIEKNYNEFIKITQEEV